MPDYRFFPGPAVMNTTRIRYVRDLGVGQKQEQQNWFIYHELFLVFHPHPSMSDLEIQLQQSRETTDKKMLAKAFSHQRAYFCNRELEDNVETHSTSRNFSRSKEGLMGCLTNSPPLSKVVDFHLGL